MRFCPGWRQLAQNTLWTPSIDLTALDKLTIGVDSVISAGLETQIVAARGREQVQIGEFTSFWTLSVGTRPKKYHSDQC
jgi:hypothetical protein